ncbi:MAG: hypothetical protein HS115_00665 [Spirochaetales bacterium]|nr:hypothetical protein [Spirochaetales bacterium]
MNYLRPTIILVFFLLFFFPGHVRAEFPYEKQPLYQFAREYAEANALGLYSSYLRYIGNKEGIFAPIIATHDGGALLVATANGDQEAVVIRFDASRKVLWKKSFRKAGKRAIEGHAAVMLPGGGFYVDLGPFAHPATANQIWLLKLDDQGSVVWELLFRGSGNENNPAADRLHLSKNQTILIYGHIYPTRADLRAERSFGWTATVGANGKLIEEATAKQDVNYSNDETAERYPW